MAAAVRRHGLEERIFVSSTWAGSLRRLGGDGAVACARDLAIRAIAYGAAGFRWPHVVTAGGAAALRAAMPVRAPLLLMAARANALSLHHTLVSPAVVRVVHARGSAVIAWTVNDPRLIERVVAAGVDAVVSDDPATALSVLATLNPP